MPDLVLSTDPSGPAEVTRDQDTTVSVMVRNEGSASVSALFDVTAYLSTDTTFSVDDVLAGDAAVSGTLDSAQTRTLDVPVSIRSLQAYGDYFWILKVDQSSVIDESDESNNVRVGNAVAVIPDPPDLVITTLPSGPASLARMGEYAMEVTIQNVGLGATTVPFDVSVYLSADGTFDETDTRVGQTIITDTISPGGTRTPEIDIAVPDSQAYGAYVWLAVVDVDTAQVESDESNNWLAGTGAEVIEQVVDLVAATPPAGPNGVFRSQSYTVTVDVRNQGNGITTAAFDVVVYLSSNLTVGDEDDIRMGDVAVTSTIDSGQVVTVQVPVQISALQTYGTYHWVVQLDDGGFIAESNEANNHLIGNAFSVAPSPADLVVSASPVGPAQVAPNEATTVDLTVSNSGTGSTSGAFQVSVYLTADDSVGNGDDVRVGSSSVTGLLASGDTQALTVTIAIPTEQAVGEYRWLAIADINNVETESDEANNSAFSDSTVNIIATPPDLFILADPAGDPEITRGRQDTLTVLIRNQGAGDVTAGFQIAAYLSLDNTAGNDDDIRVGLHEVSSVITVGGEIAVGVPVNPPGDTPLGAYRWVVTVDPDNAFPETDETNNTRLGSSVSVIPIPPDLTVGGVLGPEQIALGGGYTVIIGIQNVGAAETLEPYDVTVYLSLDDTTGNADDVIVGSVDVEGALAPDSVRFVSIDVDIPGNLSRAIYKWLVFADQQQRILESNETNNAVFGNAVGFAVTTVDPDTIDFGEVPLGNTVMQTLTVRNDGDAPLAFDLTTSSSMVRAEPQSVSNLLPGQGWQITLTYTAVAPGNLDVDLQITGNGHPGVRTVPVLGRTPNPGFVILDIDSRPDNQNLRSTWMVPGRRLPVQLFVLTLPNSGSVSVLFRYDPALMAYVDNGFEPGEAAGPSTVLLEEQGEGLIMATLTADPGLKEATWGRCSSGRCQRFETSREAGLRRRWTSWRSPTSR